MYSGSAISPFAAFVKMALRVRSMSSEHPLDLSVGRGTLSLPTSAFCHAESATDSEINESLAWAEV